MYANGRLDILYLFFMLWQCNFDSILDPNLKFGIIYATNSVLIIFDEL